MKALILGGGGFIGFALARKLASSGQSVDIADLAPFKPGSEEAAFCAQHKIGFMPLDLCDPASVKKPGNDYDFIFHLAALLGVENVFKNPALVLEKNVVMTSAAIEIAKRQKHLKKFFFASTSEVYAGTLHYYSLTFPTPESTPLTVAPLDNPRTSYMLSKIYGEAITRASGLPFVIVRPHNIYGPRMGMRHVVPQLFEKIDRLKDGDALEIYSPSHMRTFCFIDDAVAYLVHLMDIPQKDVVVNLGCETPERSIEELAHEMMTIAGKKLTLKPMPDTPGSPPRRVPCTKFLRQLTGLEPATSHEGGLRQTYQWYHPRFSA